MELINRLSSLPRLHFFIAGVVVAALIHFMKMSDHADLASKIESSKLEIVEAKSKLKSAQNISLEKPKFEKEIQDMKVYIDTATEIMPQNHSQREIIESIVRTAKESNVRVPILRPSAAAPAKTVGSHETVLYEAELEGRYTDITNFFFNITKLKPLIHVRNLSFSKKDKIDGVANLKVNTAFLAFKYAPVDPNAPLPNAKGTKK